MGARSVIVSLFRVQAMTSSESPTHPDAPRAPTGDEGCLDWTAADRADFDARVIAGASTTGLNRDALASPDAPRARGETPEMRVDNLLRDFQDACESAVRAQVRTDSDYWERASLQQHRAILRNELRASLLARHRDGERAEWHRRMSDEHCGTDEIVGYGPYHAEMLSDEALFLELGEEIFTVYFDKKKPCLNDGRAHRKGVLQMRYEETRARSAPPSPERASK